MKNITSRVDIIVDNGNIAEMISKIFKVFFFI